MNTIIIICSVLCVASFYCFLVFLSNPIRKKNEFKNNKIVKSNQRKILYTGIFFVFSLLIFNLLCIFSNNEKNVSLNKNSSASSSSASSSTSESSSELIDSELSNSSSSEDLTSSSNSSTQSSEEVSEGINIANGISINDYFETDDNGKAIVTGKTSSNSKSIYVKNSFDDSSMTSEVKSDGTFSFEYQLQSADSEIALFLISETEKDSVPFDQWVMTDVIPSTNYERKVEDASKEKEEQELDEYNKKQQEKLIESSDEEDGGN